MLFVEGQTIFCLIFAETTYT